MGNRHRDSYLELLLDTYIPDGTRGEGRDGRFPTHLTLVLAGSVVTGRPISAERYYKRTGEQAIAAIERDYPEGDDRREMIEAYQNLYEVLASRARDNTVRLEELEREFDEQLEEGEPYSDEQEAVLEEYRRVFLHLEEVTVFSGKQPIRGDLLRIRLADISGWALGTPSG